MTTDILYAVALVMEQIDATHFTLITEAVKMTMDECLKQAVLINIDNTHPYIMSCTPFIEQAVAS